MDTIRTIVPPLPVFIKGAKGIFRKGKTHFRRKFHIFDLLFVTKGALYMKEEEKTAVVKEGEYLILAPFKEHSGQAPCDEDTEFFWIHFILPSSYELVEDGELDWSHIVKRKNTYTESDLYELYLPRFGKFTQKEQAETMFWKLIQVNETNDPGEKMKQQTYFFDIIIHIQKNALELPTSAQKIASLSIQFIEAYYSDPAFRVKEIAQELLYHPDYVSRALKSTIGMTPVQYLNDYRLSKAKKLLQEDNKDLQTISKETGFSDVSYFSRVFRKKEGMTPGQYRRQVNLTDNNR
jgi:AraC-like DNA-binding protein